MLKKLKPKKTKVPKISFLIAAHNEEKIIRECVETIANLPSKKHEIIVGLDGCTDRTEEIVKELAEKHKNLRYFSLNLRQGKNAVINEIIKKARGEIVVINDADWIFISKDKKSFDKFFSVFDNPKIGGIAESFPAEWHKDRIENSDIGYKMEAYSSFLWYEFQKEKFTYEKEGLRCLKEPTMFLTNIFRKNLYKENLSLGDDFERTHYIMSQGYKIVQFDNDKMPRIKTTYNTLKIKDIFRLKIRTAVARAQLNERNLQNITIGNYYFPFIVYALKESMKKGLNWFGIILFWIILSSTAAFFAGFKKIGTKEGWKIRQKR
ncbi:glycosyltransferase [Candidatus Pacearchaeota archaeon]|nr:glycosyltransferase [Candidatus Pacearchaeota archaeon]